MKAVRKRAQAIAKGRGRDHRVIVPLAFETAARISARPLDAFRNDPTQLAKLLKIVWDKDEFHSDFGLGTVALTFALGTLLLSAFQQTEHGHQAGIGSFLTGHAASLVRADLVTALGLLAATALTFVALSWDLRTSTFDPAYARASGRPTGLLGALTAVLAVGTVVAGMQAVGLVLVLALIVIPPAAARRLSDRFLGVVALAAAIGACAGAAGSVASATLPRVPTGAAIVLALGASFLVAAAVGRIRSAA